LRKNLLRYFLLAFCALLARAQNSSDPWNGPAVSACGDLVATLLETRPLGQLIESRGDSYPNAMAISYDERGIVWISTTKDGAGFGLDG
jgi:hypothetical protein